MHPDDALRPALARASSSSLLVVAGLTVIEVGVRALVTSVRFPDPATAALEAVAHLGQVAPLAVPLGLAHLLGAAVASTSRGRHGAEWMAGTLRLLAAPARVARLLGVWGAAWLALSKTAGMALQLPYHAGAVFAVPVVAMAVVAEVGVARIRRVPPPPRPSAPGVLCWLAALILLSTLVTPRVSLAHAGALAALLPLLVWSGLALGGRSLPRAVIVGGYAALLAGVVVDARRAELRRFSASCTPYASLGHAVAVWATDVDGDGASSLLGLDCDDADPFRSPIETDLPDDGIDQNCRGGDGSLVRALARYERGGLHGPPPPSAPLAGAARRPDVFLVTLDAARADLFERRDLLPETLAFASRCIRFTQARAAAPSTGESLVSLHAGVHARHVVMGDAWLIDLAAPASGKMSTPPTLAAALAIVAGYHTAAVLPAFHAENFSFLTGYVAGGTLPETGTAFHAPAAAVLDAARKHAARPSPETPVHVRAHLMDLHTPYLGGSDRMAYERSARALDPPLAAFLGGLPRDAIVVLTADHGEAFGEHGYTEHGHTLFDEELRVPLALCAPSELGLGPPRTVDVPVSLADVTPTLLDLLGIVVPYRRHGVSLIPLLRGSGRREPAWVYFESLGTGQRGVLSGCDKWLEDPVAGYRVLFDVCVDPGETHDLRRTEAARAERAEQLLAEIVDLDLDAFRSWRTGSPR